MKILVGIAKHIKLIGYPVWLFLYITKTQLVIDRVCSYFSTMAAYGVYITKIVSYKGI